MSSHTTRLWLAIRLPCLPLEALVCSPASGKPAAVIEKQRVICANQSALQAGVSPGMPQATAQALCHCDIYERDQALETQVLKALAESAYRFTPYVEFHRLERMAQGGLLLEISRCLKLFNGLPNLYRLLADFFQVVYPDYTFCYGLAHTAPGAWLLSHDETADIGTLDDVPDKAHFIRQLEQLPIQLLQAFPEAVESLDKTGFDTLGDIARQVNSQTLAPLRKRFGSAFCDYIGAVFDIENNFQQKSLFDKPLATYKPEEYFNRNMQFDYPIGNIELLKVPMENLLQQLDAYLNQRQLQTQGVEWRLYDIYQNRETIKVNCVGGNGNNKASWKLLLDLSVIQLEGTPLPFEVDILELECKHATPLEAANRKLSFDGKKGGSDHELEVTLAKLTARLGQKAIYKVGYNNSHIPEQSSVTLPVNQNADSQLPVAQQFASRPAWLLNSPMPIRYKNSQLDWQGKLDLIQGPERIEGNWWETPIARDYFIARREDNLRIWIFYDLYSQQWYAHGVF